MSRLEYALLLACADHVAARERSLAAAREWRLPLAPARPAPRRGAQKGVAP